MIHQLNRLVLAGLQRQETRAHHIKTECSARNFLYSSWFIDRNCYELNSKFCIQIPFCPDVIHTKFVMYSHIYIHIQTHTYKYNINLIELLSMDVAKENLPAVIPTEHISEPYNEDKVSQQRIFSRRSGCKGRSDNFGQMLFSSSTNWRSNFPSAS